MKYVLFAVLSIFSMLASANDNTNSTSSAAADTQYDYTHDLDIAKIVRISNASAGSNECGPLRAQMEYLDSKGVSHTLEYTRLGEDCAKG